MNDSLLVNRREMIGLIGAAGIGSVLPAQAQSDFPNRPLRLVIGLPAGGGADVVMRALALEMERTLKQPIVIENKPGALFQLAVNDVASAPADGYTLLYVFSSFATVQAVQKRFDLTKQFQPLTVLGETPSVLLVNANSPFKTMKDLVDYGRANPDKLTYGTLGVGSLEHLKSAKLAEEAGFKARAIPYKGGPAMVNAVLSGEIDYTGVNIFTAKPFVDSGRMRALAALDKERLKALPDVPSVMEVGVGITTTTHIWSGFMVRAGTPAPIVQRLYNETVAAMNTSAMVSKLAPLGIQNTTSKSPAEFGKFIDSEVEWMSAMSKKLDLDGK